MFIKQNKRKVRTVVFPFMINLLQYNITQQNLEGKIDLRW